MFVGGSHQRARGDVADTEHEHDGVDEVSWHQPLQGEKGCSAHGPVEQLGNTMSVNVLERTLHRLLPATGLTMLNPNMWADRWEDGIACMDLVNSINKELIATKDAAKTPVNDSMTFCATCGGWYLGSSCGCDGFVCHELI